MSSFWQCFFKNSGTQLRHSSAYHPETDGQTEITNRGLEQYLRCFCMEQPTKWVKFLPWAEFSYNTAVHSATKMTPFFAVYGRHPPIPLLNSELQHMADHQMEEISHRNHILRLLRTHLAEARNRMKQMADKHRRDIQFQVGDRVLIKLQPYRQSSLANQSFSKLRRQYFGPFPILQKIGQVAYKVELPAYAKLHPVFHVSKLKLFKEDLNMHAHILPPLYQEGMLILQPKAIISHKWLITKGASTLKLLVQWDAMPTDAATWMDVEEFKSTYPTFNLEDKVFSKEGSNDVGPLVYTRRAKVNVAD